MIRELCLHTGPGLCINYENDGTNFMHSEDRLQTSQGDISTHHQLENSDWKCQLGESFRYTWWASHSHNSLRLICGNPRLGEAVANEQAHSESSFPWTRGHHLWALLCTTPPSPSKKYLWHSQGSEWEKEVIDSPTDRISGAEAEASEYWLCFLDVLCHPL